MFITPDFNSEVLHQMEVTDQLLSELDHILINPLVAGGAPRDWYFNKTCKDVDIFVDPETDHEVLCTRLRELTPHNVLVQTSEQLSPEYRSDYISRVVTFRFKRTKIQIIFKISPDASLLKHFPVSLSMISYQNYSIIPSCAFTESVRTATLCFLRGGRTEYIDKISNYFSNYRKRSYDLEDLICPDDNQKIRIRAGFGRNDRYTF